ncbi:MAG: hypothetical protein BWY76_01240 [bacterium ADurb.Bin429]|nr:MAG: hypothetical protein BWY76_01240 [bacterium ADurb.Bin429]
MLPAGEVLPGFGGGVGDLEAAVVIRGVIEVAVAGVFRARAQMHAMGTAVEDVVIRGVGAAQPGATFVASVALVQRKHHGMPLHQSEEIMCHHQRLVAIGAHRRAAAPGKRRAAIRVANIPEDVVVNKVASVVHLRIDAAGEGFDIMEYVAGDAVIHVAAVQPKTAGMAQVTERIVADEAVSGQMKFQPHAFPHVLEV